MNAVEAYVQFEPGLISDDGRATNKSTEDFLRQYIEEFAAFIARVYTVVPRKKAAQQRATSPSYRKWNSPRPPSRASGRRLRHPFTPMTARTALAAGALLIATSTALPAHVPDLGRGTHSGVPGASSRSCSPGLS